MPAKMRVSGVCGAVPGRDGTGAQVEPGVPERELRKYLDREIYPLLLLLLDATGRGPRRNLGVPSPPMAEEEEGEGGRGGGREKSNKPNPVGWGKIVSYIRFECM